MTREQAAADAAVILTIVNGTMPDGSSIRSSVKAEAVLAYLGITDFPPALRHLLAVGIGQKKRAAQKRVRTELGHADA